MTLDVSSIESAIIDGSDPEGLSQLFKHFDLKFHPL